MEAKDLRIGNLIIYEQTTHSVCGILNNKIYSWWVHRGGVLVPEDPYADVVSSYKPILLSEEWILKLGWVKSKDKGLYGDIYKISPCDYNFILERDFNDELSYFFKHEFTDCPDPEDDFQPISIAFNMKYVHQLQNLYFSLVGEELTTSFPY